jgi:cell pole-organizing protein PopZ
MAQAAKSQEPSMEEILASIRRIIAEDDSEKPAQRPPETASV